MENILFKSFGILMFIVSVYLIFTIYPFMSYFITFAFVLILISHLIKKRFKTAGLYFLYVLIWFSLYNFNMGIAKKRFLILINTVNKFKIENGKYPNALKDLVPNYINEIPNVNYKIDKREELNKFNYYITIDNKDAVISWNISSPLEREVYYFEDKEYRIIN